MAFHRPRLHPAEHPSPARLRPAHRGPRCLPRPGSGRYCSWRGADALRLGGPAEELLHALENALDEQLSSHQPVLLGLLARQVNAAWAQLTRSPTETAVNLAAP
ncbi:hypothetical protein [Streptomyces sp. NPDC001759]